MRIHDNILLRFFSILCQNEFSSQLNSQYFSAKVWADKKSVRGKIPRFEPIENQCFSEIFSDNIMNLIT